MRVRRFKLAGQKPIVVVGSINVDLVTFTERIPAVGETVIGDLFQIHPGGKGANQAVAVARLGYPVRMIGRLGNDTFGELLKTQLQESGVEIAGVGTSEGASGVAVIEVSRRGENTIIVTPGANDKLTPRDLETNLSIIRQAGIVLAQLETPLETVEYLGSLCAREGVPLILDPAPARELPLSIFEHTAWFTPNQTEAEYFIAGPRGEETNLGPSEIARRLMSKGVGGVVLKMGEQGAYVASKESAGQTIAAFPVKAIDTTAAGDAFNGGFATGLMLGKMPIESAKFATAVAAISVTRSGAQPSMPNMNEVETFMEKPAVKINRHSEQTE
jgi:ribokinase